MQTDRIEEEWVRKAKGNTYTASSNFFSAMALLPRALSSSTEAMVGSIT